jgi:hypothetical protein
MQRWLRRHASRKAQWRRRTANIAPETVNVESVDGGKPRVDCRRIAAPIGVMHRYLFRQLLTHEGDFALLGPLRFENAVGGRPPGRPSRNRACCAESRARRG